MLSYTLFRALTFPLTYLLAFILVATAIMQIRYLNRGLQRFDATQVIPTQFVLFTLSVILGSAILYRDFERTEAANAGEFIGGCALTFAGVWLITSGRKRSSDDEEAELYDDFDGDAIDLAEEEYEDERAESHVASRRSSAQVSMPFGMSAVSSRRQSKLSPPQSPQEISFEPPLATPQTPNSDILTEPASLVDNPWLSSVDGSPIGSPARRSNLPVPPPLQSSTSEPLLPIDATERLRPHTPDPSAAAHTHATLPSAAAHTHAQPATPRTNPDNIFRQSLTELVPGPLMTPLSSSLSAVVADTLRRGIDGASLRRRRSIARARLPNMPSPHPHTPMNGTRARGASEADLDAIGGTLGSMSQPQRHHYGATAESSRVGETPEGSPSVGQKRGRAFSNTLGRLFKSKKVKGKRRDDRGQDHQDTQDDA